MKAIPVIISRVFAPAVTDAYMHIAPLFETVINGIFIRVHTRARSNCGLDQRLDGPLLDIVQHADDHLATTLDHAEDRGLLCGEGPAATVPLQSSAPAMPPFFTTCSGLPLWPATM